MRGRLSDGTFKVHVGSMVSPDSQHVRRVTFYLLHGRCERYEHGRGGCCVGEFREEEGGGGKERRVR